MRIDGTVYVVTVRTKDGSTFEERFDSPREAVEYERECRETEGMYAWTTTAKEEPRELNKAQRRTLDGVRRSLETDGREVKACSYEVMGTGAAIVNIQTGIIGDDGSWRYVTKRSGYCFTIGPRGGIYESVTGKKRRVRNHRLTDIYARNRSVEN
jgi:hypothetical protein